MAEPIKDMAATGEARDPAIIYQAGNEADFERLYLASYGKILGTLTAMLGDRAAAEDCAQDAFERAYKKWATWQPIAPAEAWVHRIAINAAVSYQRKMRLREVGEVIRRIGRPELAPDPQEHIEHRDRASPLPRLHQSGDRPVPWHTRAHGGLTAGRGQGSAPSHAPPLVRRGGRLHQRTRIDGGGRLREASAARRR